jgi:hypothetical protein
MFYVLYDLMLPFECYVTGTSTTNPFQLFMEQIENCKQDLDTTVRTEYTIARRTARNARVSQKSQNQGSADLHYHETFISNTMNMTTNPNRYPRRQRHFSSKNLDYTFWEEEQEEPQEQVIRQQLPSSPQISRNSIQSPRWPRLLVRAPSRRVPRRFAFVVPMKHSS